MSIRSVLSGERPVHIECGDSLETLKRMEAESIHVCMTSPPYYALRSYLNQDSPLKAMEIGSEKIHDCQGWVTHNPCGSCYLCHLLAVFAEIKRVLRQDGVLIVNIGDSYSGNSNIGRRDNGRPEKGRGWAEYDITVSNVKRGVDVQDGALLGIPWRFALAMQSQGWLLRSSVIWAKLSPMPESVSGWNWSRHRIKTGGGWTKETHPSRSGIKGDIQHSGGVATGKKVGVAEGEPCPGCDRCSANNGYVLRKGSWRPTRSHEHVFIFAKSSSYWCDGDAVRTPAAPSTLSRDQYTRITSGKDGPYAVQHDHETPTNPLGANLRDTLVLGPEPCSIACICQPSPDCPLHAGQPGPIYVDRPPPSWKKCTCERTSHFAAFPTTLCRPFLEAFCPQRCCAACGTGWVRVVERGAPPPKEAFVNTRKPDDGFVSGGRRTGGIGEKYQQWKDANPDVTLGWRPACSCNSQAEPVPGLALDCFSGTGTLALTARRMGLRAIGVELSESYCVLSRERIRRDSTLFNEVAEPVPVAPPSPEPDLFGPLEG